MFSVCQKQAYGRAYDFMIPRTLSHPFLAYSKVGEEQASMVRSSLRSSVSILAASLFSNVCTRFRLVSLRHYLALRVLDTLVFETFYRLASKCRRLELPDGTSRNDTKAK